MAILFSLLTLSKASDSDTSATYEATIIRKKESPLIHGFAQKDLSCYIFKGLSYTVYTAIKRTDRLYPVCLDQSDCCRVTINNRQVRNNCRTRHNFLSSNVFNEMQEGYTEWVKCVLASEKKCVRLIRVYL